jgi:hypothetical protein
VPVSSRPGAAARARWLRGLPPIARHPQDWLRGKVALAGFSVRIGQMGNEQTGRCWPSLSGRGRKQLRNLRMSAQLSSEFRNLLAITRPDVVILRQPGSSHGLCAGEICGRPGRMDAASTAVIKSERAVRKAQPAL